jgi:hypothetical protein
MTSSGGNCSHRTNNGLSILITLRELRVFASLEGYRYRPSPHFDSESPSRHINRCSRPTYAVNRMRTGLGDEFGGDLTVRVFWNRTCTEIRWRF